MKRLRSLLFVYGTLMSMNSAGHTLLENAAYMGSSTLESYALYEIDWYPGIVEKKGCKVIGELYEIDEGLLESLDDYEEEGTLYIRKLLKVIAGKGQELEAYVYIYNASVDGLKLIDEADQPWRG